MIFIIIRKIYPAAEPDALVDIVLVGVVVPLDAVQNGSSADHQRHREEDDHRSTRKQRTKRVVVPQRHSPKTWLPPFTRAGELVDGSVSEAYSSVLVHARTWTGKTVRQQNQWNCCVSVRRKSDQSTLLSCACGRWSAGGALSFPHCHQSPETPKLRRKTPAITRRNSQLKQGNSCMPW